MVSCCSHQHDHVTRMLQQKLRFLWPGNIFLLHSWQVRNSVWSSATVFKGALLHTLVVMTTWIEAAHQHIILDHVYKTKYVDLLQCDWLGICVEEQLNRCAYWSSQMWCTSWTDHESPPHIHIYGHWRSPTECFWTALEEARVTRESKLHTEWSRQDGELEPRHTMLVTVPPGLPISSANTIQKTLIKCSSYSLWNCETEQSTPSSLADFLISSLQSTQLLREVKFLSQSVSVR